MSPDDIPGSDGATGGDEHAAADDVVADEHAADTRDRRLRLVAIELGVGLGLAVLGALGVGVAGGSGTAGAAVLLLVLSLTFAIGATTALVTTLVDDYRGRPVGRSRVVVGIVLFVAAAAFMAMTAGVGG